MMRSLVASFLAATLVAGTAPRVAFADDPPDYTAAKMHYANAEKAMQDGKYDDAASEYGVAYDITKDPVLFLKIGNAEEKAGKCAQAVVYWNRYLKEGSPSEDFKESTQAKIDGCSGTGAGTGTGSGAGSGTADTVTGTGTGTGTGAGSEAEPETGTGAGSGTGSGAPSFLESGGSGMRTAGWISIGASVALATAGGIMAMAARSKEEDVNSLSDFRDPNDLPAAYDGVVKSRYESLVKSGQRDNTLSVIAFGAAGAAAITAAVLLVLDSKNHHGESASAITVIAAPHEGGLAASLHF